MHVLKRNVNMALTTYGTKIDLRPLALRERHPLIFNTFRSLDAGESVELINDHDPAPLLGQFRAEWPGGFAWDDLQSGPEVWRVRIVKVPAQRDGRCCGACGGA
jgi:uncharacterized protein (DUF2249 family)